MSHTIDTVPAFHIEVGDYVGIPTQDGYSQGIVKSLDDQTDFINGVLIDEYEDEIDFTVQAMDDVDLIIDED